MQLVPNFPKEWFVAWPNIKFYVGALQKPLLDILDMEKFKQLPGQIILDKIPDTKHITFIRHLESTYNEYKESVKKNSDYIEFMSTQDIPKKKLLAESLLNDFLKQVGIDYETWLSEAWKKEWEEISKLYAEFIKNNPELFPDVIYISPYVRTKLTAHYFLKNIAWLDIDFEKLIDETKLEDLIVWSFQGKEVAIKIDERIRERDHGSNIAPNFIRNFRSGTEWFHDKLSQEQKEKIYYYTSPTWGESQVQTNARSKEFLLRNYKEDKPKNTQIFSHHLTELWALLSVFGGSFQTFYKLNNLWIPENGSMTILSQIPKTNIGQENKFRVSAYNLSLKK